MKHNIIKIAQRNGKHVARDKAIEELNEAIEAIESNIDEHMVEEIADVFITLNQVIYLHDLSEALDKQIDYKIKRTMERLCIE